MLTLFALITVTVLFAEGFILQALLLANDVAHLVQHLHRLLIALALLALSHATRLQRFQHVAKLAQHILRLIARALARHVFQVVEHLVEIFLAQDLVRVHALDRRIVLGLPLHLLHEFRECLPQLLHQAFDLLVVGTVLQCFRQLILGIAQAPLGRRQRAAIFQPQRHVPKLIHDRFHTRPRTILGKTVIRAPQPEESDAIVEVPVRLDRQRIDRFENLTAPARILDQFAALLDDRLYKRFCEAALR